MYKVLLVEDEDMIRRGIRFSIDWLKYDCIVIEEGLNGQDGLEKIYEHKPDIVITDINMPMMDGITMIREGLEKHTFSSIIISGYNEFHLAKQAIQLGVTEFLVKPLEDDQLIEALESAKAKVELQRKYEIIVSHPQEKEEILNSRFLEKETKTSKYVSRMIAYVQENYPKKISIHDLVEELGLSAYYLNQKFKAETSYTFNDFLNRYRIQKSIDLLKAGEGKVYTIAQDIGFSDYKYFISIFKKYANGTPSQYLDYFGEKEM
ncbi:response regulator transcription factor [Paenibacillus guangzhouensis]|uniref:response regulator transcription factor n=1 Tax=Paenibacillus guangzhouensis TaxID=1473112 RepID=UPI001266F41D|nr:response regulator [Paenibacillus guangzhouensis]